MRGKYGGKGTNRKKGKKKKEEGRKKGNSSKKIGKYPYFVFLVNIGPYNR